ncbi:MAG TPA: FAD-dependent oxidoreductase [Rhodocyclaceae bacterium]|nr:FAD-dependent oxidoreductase [Rhodocyclaceae bacterium]
MKPGELERHRSQINGRKKVAVIGSGIAGLATAWLLRDTHEVTLYEADSRLGGHTHTVDVEVDGAHFPVDTGFLVFNRRTYPNLCALFEQLGIESVASDMSFSARIEALDLEWAGSDLNTVFGQRRNLLRPSFLGMVRDILRFNRETCALQKHSGSNETLGEFLERRKFGSPFRDWYLLPMAAAIWSCPTATMLAYPLATFVRFCHNHGLLQILDRPHWLSVKGGGREYVRRLAAELPDVRLATPVLAVQRDANGVTVHTGHEGKCFDEVVFACHSDQTLAILGHSVSPAERAILSAIKYQPNRAVLHTDVALLPQRRRLWSAWNYAAGPHSAGNAAVDVTYLLNMLQSLPVTTPVMVSLNPYREPAADKVIAEFDYAHPVFDQAAITAQSMLPSIQGRDHFWFCGAWTQYGFHEDGLRSALAVAEGMGVSVPWLSREAAVSA